MSKMDDYLNRYLIEHNEYGYVIRIKIKKYAIIFSIILILCIIVNPLTRIKKAYIQKFNNYAAQENTSLNEILNLEKKEQEVNESKISENIQPVTGIIINPYGNGHSGIDIQGEHRANILAIDDGIVTFAGSSSGYGNCIEIEHTDKNGEKYYSFYAHLYQINVIVNQKINKAQVIGIEGGQPGVDPNPGNSTGHHLHFEIRKIKNDYKYTVDPSEYIF